MKGSRLIFEENVHEYIFFMDIQISQNKDTYLYKCLEQRNLILRGK